MSRTTMLLHRRNANRKRVEAGVCKYRWGPRVPASCERFIFERMTPTAADLVLASTGSEYALLEVSQGEHNAYSTLQEDWEDDNENVSDDDTTINSIQTSLNSADSDVVDVSNNILDIDERSFSDIEHDNQEGRTGSSGFEVLGPVEEDNASAIDSREDNRRRPEVLQWLLRNYTWIRLGDKWRIPEAGMNEILHNIDAPLQTWKSVIDNVVHFSGLHEVVEQYDVCGNHMAFVPKFPNETPPLTCSQCGSESPSTSGKKANTFFYLPILPRFEKIFRDASSCSTLYQYRRTRVKRSDWILDYFDGEHYKRLCTMYGGEQELDNDIFIGVSADGFQPFKNKQMDVWSIAAINFNLPPEERYRSPNVLPLGFVPGPSEPSNLQSFLQPLVNELRKVPRVGCQMMFHDGSVRKVRIHLIYVSGDQPAISKMSGLAGHCAARPCRDCNIEGIFHRGRGKGGHYYYPSRVNRTRSGRINKLYDIKSLPYRTALETKHTLGLLEMCSAAESARIRRRTGIRSGTVFFQLPTTNPSSLPPGSRPYSFFPHDIMHLFYNIQKEMINLWMTRANDPYYIHQEIVLEMDRELNEWSQSISGQVGPKPRAISEFRRWKAADHKAFTLYYAPIVLNGVLPSSYLEGVDLLGELSALSFQVAVRRNDVEALRKLSEKYVDHYEKKYYMLSSDRINFCKSVFHILLHLGDCLKNYGPLVGVSQYWKEGYIGWINQRSNARFNVATSMFKFCLYAESIKSLYQTPLYATEDKQAAIANHGGFLCLGPSHMVELDNLRDRGRYLRQLLSNYFVRKYGSNDAGNALQLHDAKGMSRSILNIKKHSRVRFNSTKEVQTAHVKSRRTSARRDSHYVAVEMELTTDGNVDVYYGRLLDIMEFEVNWFPDIPELTIVKDYSVGVFDWAVDVEVERRAQVFVRRSMDDAFKEKSVEDLEIAKRLYGVVEHKSFDREVDSAFPGRRLYFIDPMMRSQGLLDSSYISLDGINRNIKTKTRTNS